MKTVNNIIFLSIALLSGRCISANHEELKIAAAESFFEQQVLSDKPEEMHWDSFVLIMGDLLEGTKHHHGATEIKKLQGVTTPGQVAFKLMAHKNKLPGKIKVAIENLKSQVSALAKRFATSLTHKKLTDDQRKNHVSILLNPDLKAKKDSHGKDI